MSNLERLFEAVEAVQAAADRSMATNVTPGIGSNSALADPVAARITSSPASSFSASSKSPPCSTNLSYIICTAALSDWSKHPKNDTLATDIASPQTSSSRRTRPSLSLPSSGSALSAASAASSSTPEPSSLSPQGPLLLQSCDQTAHTGASDGFPCPLCSRVFSKRYNQQAHMRIHTNTRPFACQICGKAFMWKSSLKSHGKMHSKSEISKPSSLNDRLPTASRTVRRPKAASSKRSKDPARTAGLQTQCDPPTILLS